MSYKITDKLQFQNKAISRSLDSEDYKEIVEKTLAIIPSLSRAGFGGKTYRIKEWVDFIESKINKLDMCYKIPKLDRDAPDYDRKLRTENKNTDIKNKIVRNVKTKLEVIKEELTILEKLIKIDGKGLTEKVTEVDITNSIAKVLDALQIKGYYQMEDGRRSSAISDIYSIKTHKIAPFFSLECSKIVKDVNGEEGFDYGLVIASPDNEIIVKWHMNRNTLFELARGKEIQIYLPEGRQSGQDIGFLINEMKIEPDHINCMSLERFEAENPQSLTGRYSNLSSIKKLSRRAQHHAKKSVNKSGRNSNHGESSGPGDK